MNAKFVTSNHIVIYPDNDSERILLHEFYNKNSSKEYAKLQICGAVFNGEKGLTSMGIIMYKQKDMDRWRRDYKLAPLKRFLKRFMFWKWRLRHVDE